MKTLVWFFFLASSVAWGGRSLRLTTNYVVNESVAVQAVTQSCTVETQITITSGSPQSFEHLVQPCGLRWSFTDLGGGDIRVGAYWARANSLNGCQSPRLSTILPSPAITFYFRFILDTTNLSSPTLSCEIWDINLARAWGTQIPQGSYSGENSYGVFLFFPGSGATDYGFFRVLNIALEYGGAAPYTAYNSNMLVHWKWDLGNNTGSLTDASGHGYTASMSGGSPTYVAQSGQNLVVANPKTCDAPEWATWRTQRVGITGQTLCGGESITQADFSSLTYQWTQTAGPASLTFGSPTSATTTANGYAVHGGYSVELKVTDSAMNTNTRTLNYGAATCDSNGVLTPRTPEVTKIYGPMICFGYSSWGYMDERALYMVGGQHAYFTSLGLDDPSWSHTGAGTVTYPFTAQGVFGVPGATLDGDITDSATSMVIDGAGNLPCMAAVFASGAPCLIFFGTDVFGTNTEVARICSASAATGDNVTVGFCYDGRGISWTNNQGSGSAFRSAHTSGVVVGSKQYQGTGTSFISDATVPLCPAGVGPPGPIVYSDGTLVSVTAGDQATGSGTLWGPAYGVNQYSTMRATLTHAGGTPFDWWSIAVLRMTNLNGLIDANQTSFFVYDSSPFPATPFTALIDTEQVTVTNVSGITWTVTRGVNGSTAAGHGNGSVVTDPTHLTVAHPFPTGVDSGPFSYQFVGNRYGAFGLDTPDGGNHLGWQPVTSCESETSAFGMPARDISAIDSHIMTGQRYTYISGFGIGGTFGPNFYGPGLGLRAFWERSGYLPALEVARMIDNVWVKNPEIAGGWYGGFVLTQGGGAIGAIASKVLDSSSPLDWEDDLIYWGARGATLGARPCAEVDGRDSGLQASWVVLNQLFDPNPTRHATWTANLKDILARDEMCGASSDYGYTSAYLRENYIVVGLTNNSTAVTGTGMTSDRCYGTGIQTVSVTNGDSTVTATSGTFPMGTVYMMIGGVYVAVAWTDSTHVEMAVNWGGMSGSYPSMTRANGGDGLNEQTAFAKTVDDQESLAQNYMCIFNSPTSLTLDRPWHGTTNSYGMYTNILAGWGVQPYMLGMKMNAMTWATYSDNAGIVAGYRALLPLTATWFRNNGYDEYSKGMYYGAGFGACSTPAQTGAPVRQTYWSVPGCRTDLEHGNVQAARALTGESMSALRAYAGTGTGDRLSWGDAAYGATYGYCPWTAMSVSSTCDAHYVANELSNAALSSYKWPGFFFGLGMAHQWPAARFVIPGPPGPRLNGRGTVTGDVQ